MSSLSELLAQKAALERQIADAQRSERADAAAEGKTAPVLPGMSLMDGLKTTIFLRLLIVALLVAMIFTVGIFPTVFIFTGGYLILTRYCTVLRGLAYSAALTASVYLLFEVALEMQPYHGLLAGLLS